MFGLIELEPGLPMETVFTYSEIYPWCKIGHFGEVRRNSGVAYTNMLFFGDWDKNCKEVGSLGLRVSECRRVSTCGSCPPMQYPPSVLFWKPSEGHVLLRKQRTKDGAFAVESVSRNRAVYPTKKRAIEYQH